MKEKEFNLSEKRKEIYDELKVCMKDFLREENLDYLIRILERMLQEQDKEFIKRLKKRKTHFCGTKDCSCYGGKDNNAIIITLNELDKLCGEKLSGKPVDLSGRI